MNSLSGLFGGGAGLVALMLLAGSCTPTVVDESPSRAESSAEPASQPPGPAGDPALDGVAAELVRVIDGDSLELSVEGETVEVRLAAYNAPELYGDDRSAGATCNGQAARDALARWLDGRPIELVGDEVDRFGRTLADLLVDRRSTTEVLIADGRGLATGPDEARRRAMKTAAAERLGLWGDGCGRPATTGLMIGASQANPPGSDRDNLNEEWVEVVNRGSEPIDLDGWVIRDDTTGHRFGLEGLLASGAVLTVRSGTGRSTETDRYLDERFPVWSNSDETVLLVDPRGVVATWLFLD